MNILFKISGSIACYKACEVISRLLKVGHEVQTVTTAGAEKFIAPGTLEGLTGKPNFSDLWRTGDQMAHIRLPEWADLVILCPATANTLNKFAAGIGDDLPSTLFLAHDFSKPYLIAPAMNPRMMRHPATCESLRTLAGWGATILPTGEGRLACGDFGHGKLLEPEEIVRWIESSREPPISGPSILITAGGTEEPIDSVRVLTNRSSGKTGAYLADALTRFGAQVTLLRAHHAATPHSSTVRQETFRTVDDLRSSLESALAGGNFDCVIHAAAVSDFKVETPGGTPPTGKLRGDTPLDLHLLPAPKLLPKIKSWALGTPPPLVVGFKLTDHLDNPADSDPARSLLQDPAVDVVVHNARDSIDASTVAHPCRILLPHGEIRRTRTKEELAQTLWEFARTGPCLSQPAPRG